MFFEVYNHKPEINFKYGNLFILLLGLKIVLNFIIFAILMFQKDQNIDNRVGP